jgi:hypothetical protein
MIGRQALMPPNQPTLGNEEATNSCPKMQRALETTNIRQMAEAMTARTGHLRMMLMPQKRTLTFWMTNRR